jgi:hypothetical protein
MFYNRYLFFIFLILFIIINQFSFSAEVGDALQLLSYRVTASTRPDVTDGQIAASTDPTDWTAAYVRQMTFAVDGDTTNDTRLLTYLTANDFDSLYIGVAVELPNAATTNRLTIYFDQDTRDVLDGSLGSPGEYYVTMLADGVSPVDGHWDGSSWTANVISVAEGFGVRKGAGGLRLYNFEVQIPLNVPSDASNSYLNLTAGDEVGMLVMITDNGGNQYFLYQTNAITTDPSATGSNGKTGWSETQTIGQGVADREIFSLNTKNLVPTIDGDISGDNDWKYAFDKNIIFSDFEGNKLDGSFKIKEQATPDNLLFGVIVENITPASADYLAIYFDQGANGGDLNYILTSGGDPKFDHAVRVLGDGTYQDYYFDTTDWIEDGTGHGNGAESTSGGNWEVEFSVPLSSGDINDIDISSGDILGCLFKYYDSAADRNYWWSATINTEQIQIDPVDPVFNALGWGILQTGGPFIQTIYPEDGDTLSGEYPLAIYAIDPSDPVPETGIESIEYEIRKEDQETASVVILLTGTMSKIEDDALAIWTGTLNTRNINESADTPLKLVYKVYDGENDTVSVPIDIFINNLGGSSGVDDPSFDITSPAPNAVLSGTGVNIDFSVETVSPLNLDTVRVYIDGNLMQTYLPASTSTYSNTYNWNTANFPDGEHIIQIWAVNSINLQNISPAILVYTLNTPSVSITSPLPSALVKGTVTVSFNATPVVPSTLALSEISIDGDTWINVSSSPPATGGAGSHSWNTTSLTDATHTFQVRTTDNTGKTGYSDIISVVVDNSPPVGSLTTDLNTVKNGDTILFTYYGTEAGLTAVIPLAEIQLLDDQATADILLTDLNNDGIYTANYTIDNANTVGDGIKVITATITDNASNIFYPQATISLDNTAPLFVSLNSLDPDINYTNGETILLLATFNASGYTVTCDFSTIDASYVTGAEVIEDNSDGTYSIRYTISTSNTRGNGNYIVTVSAIDGVDLSDNGTINLLLDNSGPVVSNLTLADADDILNADDVITATVTDNDANIQGAEYFVDTIGQPGEGTSMSASDGSFDAQVENVTSNLIIGNLSEGQHVLYVRGQDVSGQWGAVVTISFIIDRRAPFISSVEINYPVDQNAARNGQTITISALFYEQTTSLSGLSILLKAAGVDSNSSAGYVMVDDGTGGDQIVGDGIYTAILTVTSLVSGSFGFTVEGSDIVPNISQIPGNILLDNTAPVYAGLIGLDPDLIYTNGETVSLMATFDASGYTVTSNFNTIDASYVIGSEASEDNGDGTYNLRYTISTTNTRGNGSYTVTVTATDDVGLTGIGTIDLRLDNSGPVVSNLALTDADDILNADDVITATVIDNDINIQGAEYFVDATGQPGEGTSMNAADGSFNSLVENVTVNFSIAGLSEGLHTLNVRGQDISGRWGAIFSIPFTIDRIAPTIEDVEIEYPENQTAASNGQIIRISTLIRETTTQLNLSQILLTSAGVDSNSNAGYVMVDDGTGGDQIIGDGIYTATLTVTSQVSGSFGFTVDASDIVPNASQISGNILLDNTAPVFTGLISLDPDLNYTNGETISLLATFDASGYVVNCDFSAVDVSYVEGSEVSEDNGNGTYSIRYTISTTNTRGNGNYTVTVTATDGVGLSDSGTIDLLLDNSGPVVSNLALSDPDDIINTDDVITATVIDNDVNIQGAEYFIDIIGQIGEGTPLSATDGNFNSLTENVIANFSITDLSEGQHTLYVRGQDISGKWGVIVSIPFTVDRLAPTIEDVIVEYPDDQIAARNSQTLRISALIREATTQLNLSQLLLMAAGVDSNSSTGYIMVDNGTGGDQISGDGIYTTTLTVTSLVSGNSGFTIQASDIVPNTSQVSGSILLDNTAPVFVSLLGLDPDLNYTNGETISLLATFDDSDYMVICDFSAIDASYVEGAEVIEDNGNNTYSIRYTISTTNTRNNGNYTITVIATDDVGLTDSGTIDLLLDNSGPVVSNLALVDPDDILNTDDVITATITDNDVNIQGAEYFVDAIGQPGEGTPLNATDGSFNSLVENVTANFSILSLSEGLHTLFVRGQDVSGKWGIIVSIPFTVDRLAPTIEDVRIEYPESQIAARNNQTISISALIREATTQLNSSQILLRSAGVDSNSSSGYVMVDDGTGGDQIVGDGIYTATLTVTSQLNGSFNFTIDASDIVPNTSQISGNIFLDNNAPVFVSLLSLDPDINYTNGETISLLATFDDTGYILTCNFSAIDVSYIEGAEVIEDNGDNTYNIRYTISTTNSRNNGSYIITVTATDSVGLTDNGIINLLLDNSGPVVSNLALSDPDDILNTDDAIAATVTDNDVNIQGAEYFIDVIGRPGEGILLSAMDGSFNSLTENVTANLSITGLSEGQHTLYIRGQDISGKWGAITSLSFIIDRLAPTIEDVTIEYPENQTAVRNSQIIRISALIREATTQLDFSQILLKAAGVDINSGAGYIMVDDGTGGDKIIGDGIYTATLTVTSSVSGSYGFTIDASDIVPNTSQISGNVLLDNAAPVFINVLGLDPDLNYANGETILLSATFDAPFYLVTCDFSPIDASYVEGAEVIEDHGNNTYSIRYTISTTNTRSNGSYTVTVSAVDSVGLTDSGTIDLLLDNSGPVVLNLALSDADDILNTDDTITATVTDNDVNIRGAEYFVDVIGQPGEGIPLSAADGSFNSQLENVTAILSITDLSEGSHTLYVRGQDVTGKWGAVVLILFTVDRLAPTIENVEIEYPDKQSAARNSQSIHISALIREATTQLNSTQILLRAAGIDINSSSGYVMVDNGTGRDKVGGDGIYTATLTVTSTISGSFGFTIEASDIVPNTSQVSGNIILDNTSPVFTSLITLDPDLNYTNGETILLLATFDAEDYNVTCNFSTIDASYVEGAEVIEDNGYGEYSIRYTISTTNTRDNGRYTITVTATDSVGLTDSGTIDLLLDNSGPVVSNLALSDPDDILNVDDIITATVTDNDAIIQGAEYFVDVIGQQGEGISMSAVYGDFDSQVEEVTANLSIAGLSEGQHTLYVRGQDVSGKWGAVVSLSFIVDRLAPSIEDVKIEYLNNQTAARNSQTIRISALIREATTQLDLSGILLEAAEIDSNSSTGYNMVDNGTGGDKVVGDGIYTAVLTVTSLESGSFTFTIEASDIVPNTSQISGNIVLDNTAPVYISFTGLDPDLNYTNGETILLLATFDAANYIVTCNFSTIDISYVQGAEVVQDNNDGTYRIRYTISTKNTREDDSYTITVTATDSVGLAVNGTIDLLLDNSGPVVSNLALSDEDDILNTNDVITAIVTDNDANIQSAEYFVDVIGQHGEGKSMSAVDSIFNSQIEEVTANLSIAGLSEGQHTLYVRGQDVSGKWGAIVSLSFIVDRLAPTIEDVKIKYPNNQIAARRNQTIHISALIRETTTRLDSTQILLKAAEVDSNSSTGYIMVDNGTGGDKVAKDGIYTALLTVTSSVSGNFIFIIEASDIVPNTSQVSSNIILDNTTPVFVGLISLDPDINYTNGETILLLATFDASGYKVTCDFSAIDVTYVKNAETVEDNGDGTYTIRYTISHKNSRINGRYIIVSTAEDGVGLKSIVSIDLILDNFGPGVSNIDLSDSDNILNADDSIVATITDDDINIKMAEYSVDVISLPGEGIAMNPVDGRFNSTIEEVTATLAIDDLSEGLHTLYIRGKDESGSWGNVISFQFIVDRIAPVIESVNIKYPEGQHAASLGQNIKITALIREETTELDSSSVRLSATEVDTNSASGYLMVDDGTNGDDVANDDIFTTLLTITSDSTGSFDFIIGAADIVPNLSQINGEVSIDNQVPVVITSLTPIPDNGEVYVNELLVTGKYYDQPDSSEVKEIEIHIKNMNGDHINTSPIKIPVNNRREFSRAIRLIEGENIISIIAKDFSSNISQTDFIIKYIPPIYTQYISILGGIISSPDGTTVNIPSDAILKGSTISIGIVSTKELPKPSEYISLLEISHDFRPDGLIFHKPVTITLTYNVSDLDIDQDGINDFQEDQLVVFLLDGNVWIKIIPLNIDLVNHTVTFVTNHFSVYALGNDKAIDEFKMYWTQNPFRPEEGTTAVFELTQSSTISLKIYDISGNLVRILADDEEVSGSTNRRWDGFNDFGRYVGSGIYIYIFEYEDITGKKKVIKKPIGVVK